MRIHGSLFAGGLMIPALLALWTAHQPAAPAKSAAFAGFPASIKSYIELRDKAKSALPAISNKAKAEEIAEYRSKLAAALKAARPSARRGDIFTPSVTADFKQVLKSETKVRPSAKKAIRDGNPVTEGNPGAVKLAVNAQYPEEQPVSVVPPGVLLKLPELPKELKYCFVGRNLLLLDAESNLIIDYIPEATT